MFPLYTAPDPFLEPGYGLQWVPPYDKQKRKSSSRVRSSEVTQGKPIIPPWIMPIKYTPVIRDMQDRWPVASYQDWWPRGLDR